MSLTTALSPFETPEAGRLQPGKFRDPVRTVDGSIRASVQLSRLQTLWFNTGTLCNLACQTCYIESSPRNDALVYLSTAEVDAYLREVRDLGLTTGEIAFTGGEPFMNPDITQMLERALREGFRALVLTNAMRPMRRFERSLTRLLREHGEALTLRVSLDHYTAAAHEAERGPETWRKAIDGLAWLSQGGFSVTVAGRQLGGEPEAEARLGYQKLFQEIGVTIDAQDAAQLVLFPQMDALLDVPEITEACWDILGKPPGDVMCATSRMVVKRKGAARPVVVACTLTPYDPQFELGSTLQEAFGLVRLNHPHCARFCVLGDASCGG